MPISSGLTYCLLVSLACKILAISGCLFRDNDSQQDIRAWKILAITGCLIPVISPSWRYWQLARYDFLWVPARYCSCEILLPVRYCSLWDIASNAMWLPARYCRQRDISYNRISVSPNLTYPATLPASEVWPPMRYACLYDINYDQMPIYSKLTSPAILTASEIWLPMIYDY